MVHRTLSLMVLSQASSGPRDLWEAPLRGRGVSGPFPANTKARPREESGSLSLYYLAIFSDNYYPTKLPKGGWFYGAGRDADSLGSRCRMDGHIARRSVFSPSRGRIWGVATRNPSRCSGSRRRLDLSKLITPIAPFCPQRDRMRTDHPLNIRATSVSWVSGGMPGRHAP